MRKATSFFVCASLIAASLDADERWAQNTHLTLYGDFLYIQRQDLHNRTLFVTIDQERAGNNALNPTDPNTLNVPLLKRLKALRKKLTTDDLIDDFDSEPGYRVGGMITPNKRWSIEGNYFWIHDWHGSDHVKGNGNLIFPFHNLTYTHDFFDADRGRGTYTSKIWGAELNYWGHLTPRRADYFSFSVIGGLRYFHINEKMNVYATRQGSTSSYNIKTEDNLAGGQLGFNMQVNPTKFLVWEATVKGGIYAVKGEQKTFLGDYGNTIVLRDKHNSAWNFASSVEAIGTVGLQLFSWLNIHAGYQALFISGLALAPEQIDKNTTPHSGHHLRMTGNALYRGVVAGLILSF